MSGTRKGGRSAAITNKERYGEDFYKKIGAKGGKLGRTGGFYVNRKLASTAGKKGGSISRRGIYLAQSGTKAEELENG